MRTRFLWAAVAALLLVGFGVFVFARLNSSTCDSEVLDSCGSDPWWRTTEIAGREVVFMPQTAAESMAPYAEGSFYPEPPEAALAEAAIRRSHGDLPGYRQYGGTIYQGHRYVLIVGFCEPGAVDWTTDIIEPLSDDSCGFRAAYDLSNDRIVWILSGTVSQDIGAVDPP